MDGRRANLFFQLVAARYTRGSLLITSTVPFDGWEKLFGDEVLASAILDRLLHQRHIFAIIVSYEIAPEADHSGICGCPCGARHSEFSMEIVRQVHTVVDDVSLDDGKHRVAHGMRFRRDKPVAIDWNKWRCRCQQAPDLGNCVSGVKGPRAPT